MNINSMLFNLKEKYETSRRLAAIKFEAEASDEIGICAYVAGYFEYAESLGGYKLYMSFWYDGLHYTGSAQTGHIDDEVSFIKACIGLINDVLGQHPEMDAVTLNFITK